MISVIETKPGHVDFLEHRYPIGINDREFIEVMTKKENARVFTLVAHGKPIAIIGAINIWYGLTEVFAMTSDLVPKYKIEFHKKCLYMINSLRENFGSRRIFMNVKEGCKTRMRWALSLGFEKECLMRSWGPDGSNYYLMARVF